MLVKLGSSSPNFRDENHKNFSCHHLVIMGMAIHSQEGILIIGIDTPAIGFSIGGAIQLQTHTIRYPPPSRFFCRMPDGQRCAFSHHDVAHLFRPNHIQTGKVLREVFKLLGLGWWKMVFIQRRGYDMYIFFLTVLYIYTLH